MELTPTTSAASWRNASGLWLPTQRRAGGSATRHHTADIGDAQARWRWQGRIVARAWPAEMDEREYRLLLVGGRKRRLAAPDRFTADGAPLYVLSDYEQRQRQRALNRHALDVYETHNIACNAGRTVLLNYVANATGLTGVQYFAVGTGAIPSGQNGPQASDTALWSEYYRAQISTATVSGDQVDLSCVFQANVANSTYTEAGVFGDGATATAGSGQLFAHALYTYTKGSSTVLTNDYFITLT